MFTEKHYCRSVQQVSKFLVYQLLYRHHDALPASAAVLGRIPYQTNTFPSFRNSLKPATQQTETDAYYNTSLKSRTCFLMAPILASNFWNQPSSTPRLTLPLTSTSGPTSFGELV